MKEPERSYGKSGEEKRGALKGVKKRYGENEQSKKRDQAGPVYYIKKSKREGIMYTAITKKKGTKGGERDSKTALRERKRQHIAIMGVAGEDM